MSDYAIDDEVLVQACFNLQRRIAATILSAMAQEGANLNHMDHAVGEQPGYCRKYLIKLIDGRASDLRPISDLSVALGREMHFGLIATSPAPQSGLPNLADAIPRTQSKET